MKVGKIYRLKPNLTIDYFFDTTSKSEFTMHLRENNKVCSPIRIEPGPTGKIAYFTFDGSPYEYDLLESYWGLFMEVEENKNSDITGVLHEKESTFHGSANLDSFKIKPGGLTPSDLTIKKLSIQTETAKYLKTLEIIEEPGLRTQDLLKFILDNIVCENPTFDISFVLGKSSVEKDQLLWDVYKAYNAKIAIDNVVALAQAEQSKLDNILDNYSYNPLGTL